MTTAAPRCRLDISGRGSMLGVSLRGETPCGGLVSAPDWLEPRPYLITCGAGPTFYWSTNGGVALIGLDVPAHDRMCTKWSA